MSGGGENSSGPSPFWPWQEAHCLREICSPVRPSAAARGAGAATKPRAKAQRTGRGKGNRRGHGGPGGERGDKAQGNGPEYGSVHRHPAGHGGVGRRGLTGPASSKAGPPGERAGRAVRGGECSTESVRVSGADVKGRRQLAGAFCRG